MGQRFQAGVHVIRGTDHRVFGAQSRFQESSHVFGIGQQVGCLASQLVEITLINMHSRSSYLAGACLPGAVRREQMRIDAVHPASRFQILEKSLLVLLD
jgi:hypothetical protein